VLLRFGEVVAWVTLSESTETKGGREMRATCILPVVALLAAAVGSAAAAPPPAVTINMVTWLDLRLVTLASGRTAVEIVDAQGVRTFQTTTQGDLRAAISGGSSSVILRLAGSTTEDGPIETEVQLPAASRYVSYTWDLRHVEELGPANLLSPVTRPAAWQLVALVGVLASVIAVILLAVRTSSKSSQGPEYYDGPVIVDNTAGLEGELAAQKIACWGVGHVGKGDSRGALLAYNPFEE
jgi:hypothetical protein